MLTNSRMYNINLCIHSCGRTCMSMLRPIAYLIHSTSMVTCIDQIPFCFKFKTWLIHIYALLKHPLHSINSTHALLINIQNYIRPQHTSCWPNFSPSSNILCTIPNQKDQTPSLIISKTLNRPLTKTLNKVYVRLSHIWALLVQSFNKINFFDLNLNDNPHCSSRFSMKQTPTKKTTPMAEYHLHHIARFNPWAKQNSN